MSKHTLTWDLPEAAHVPTPREMPMQFPISSRVAVPIGSSLVEHVVAGAPTMRNNRLVQLVRPVGSQHTFFVAVKHLSQPAWVAHTPYCRCGQAGCA